LPFALCPFCLPLSFALPLPLLCNLKSWVLGSESESSEPRCLCSMSHAACCLCFCFCFCFCFSCLVLALDHLGRSATCAMMFGGRLSSFASPRAWSYMRIFVLPREAPKPKCDTHTFFLGGALPPW
jgi:hypothetical protein